jgi:DUF1680 family protein
LGRRVFLGGLAASALALVMDADTPRRAAAGSLAGAVGGRVVARPASGVLVGSPPLRTVAARAYRGLLARLDADAGYRPRFVLDLDAAPSILLHDGYWDSIDLAGRAVDAVARLRRVLALDGLDEAEHGLRAYLLGRRGLDGLYYNESADGDEVVDVFCQSRALLGLTTWYAATGAAEVEDALDGLVRGLDRIAARQGDGSYFPGERYRERWLDSALLPSGAYDGRAKYGYGALCAQGLLELYALGGSRPALDLAGRLLRHFVEQSGLVGPGGDFVGETHAEGYVPLATAAVRYGVAADDERYLAWADRLYRWVRTNSSEFGWVPGPLGLGAAYFAKWYGTPVRRTCETCSLADTIELALTLAQNGHPEYWDDVERFTRNQLVENQFGQPSAVLGDATADVDPAALAALAGAWESFALPYRLLGRPDGRRLVEGCCSASGARALSLVWEHAVEPRDGLVYVHLGLTRDTPWASVVSHEPRRGQIDLVLPEARGLRLRLPSWTVPEQATLRVNDVRRALRWDGPYLALEALPPGSRVSVRYPLAERVEGFSVDGETTLAYWSGGTVVDVLPDDGPAATYHDRQTGSDELSGTPASLPRT